LPTTVSLVPLQPPPSEPPATVTRRLAALAYDLLLLGGLWFCLTLIAVALRGGQPIPPRTVWFDLALLGTSFGFYGWFWTHGGQTLGMRAWRIRLERCDGGQLTWRDAAYRYAAAALSGAMLGLGFWWGYWDRDRRCWHDGLSHTRVVHYSSAASARVHTRRS
jgi:uncharacterized RDD family membrane protein YckC